MVEVPCAGLPWTAFAFTIDAMVPEQMFAGAEGTFTHLHVHSHYSLLKGTASVEELAARAAAEGMSHLALTDYQAMYGAVAFARACRRRDVQAITGMMVRVTPPEEFIGSIQSAHVVLLAKNREGYRNLCRISSWLQGNAQRESKLQRGLSWDLLSAHTNGLLCIDAGRFGTLCQLIQQDREREAVRFLSRLGGLWHEEACLGIEIHKTGDSELAQHMAALGQRFGLRVVALQPVYCLEPDDGDVLRLLAAMESNCTIEEVKMEALPDGGSSDVDVHWLSMAEIAERFRSLPQALAETARIAALCEEALPGGEPIWPALKLDTQETPDSALEVQARAGLKDRYGSPFGAAISARLDAELAAINGAGFAPLFLVVADIVRFARMEQIPVSTRGSVANSLVAYCLGITTVDPIRHNLLFARFLNPARRNPPDIDLDFCSRQRDRVLDYVRRTYGESHVALVSTMNTLQPRSALRETAKAYGYSDDQIRQLVKQLPKGQWRQLELAGTAALEGLANETDRLVVQLAARVVGQPHHLGLHPGGVVITPGPLDDILPLQWSPKGYVATQYSHEDVESIGLPKLDLLGIRALTVLAEAVQLVRQHWRKDFSLEDITDGDGPTRRCLTKGETVGVFQCESEGAQRTLRQLQAARIQDLAVANAFFKPGPAMGGMAQAFVRRYRGEEPVSLLHPALGPILNGTQGILLFQEQVLRVAHEIAGLTWAEADGIRRGMSKMRPQAMISLKIQFIRGCMRPKPEGPQMSEEQAQQLWEQVLAFSGYGFNQGHATAYADVSYRSAYLKAHFPAAFLCARLANGGGFYPPAVYIAEAQRLGIGVRPPHVNHSRRRFTLGFEDVTPVLWMGLGQVRSLRRSATRSIIDKAPFKGFADLLARVSLREREIDHLIRCGALDGFGMSRAAMLAEAAVAQRAASPRQMRFDFAEPPEVGAESRAQRMAWEVAILGQPVSVHPLQLVRRLPTTTSLRDLGEADGARVRVAGIRLPGRTGGPSFLLGDGAGLIMVRSNDGTPPSWTPLLIDGVWRRDRWGGGWLQAAHVQQLVMQD